MGNAARMGVRRGVYKVLVGKLEGKRSLGIHRRRREDNIKVDIQKMAYGDMDWIYVAQDRDSWRALVKCCNEPSGLYKIRGIS